MNEIRDLIRDIVRYVRIREGEFYTRKKLAVTLVLGFPTAITLRNECLLCKSFNVWQCCYRSSKKDEWYTISVKDRIEFAQETTGPRVLL